MCGVCVCKLAVWWLTVVLSFLWDAVPGSNCYPIYMAVKPTLHNLLL